MKTARLVVDPHHPEAEPIARAAAVLRAGGLVAFPTETVYGLGANALSASAVTGIFEAKGRPANNPLIVHVGAREDVAAVVGDWPENARRLAERFWPGALTLVVPRGANVPDEVTAGGPTVAVRIPDHPVALALLRAAGVPVAAPSANRSGYISPTCAEHVLRGLDDRIALILDAGPVPGGLESTVVDVTTVPPRLLRPGLLSAREIEAVVGPMVRASEESPSPDGPLPSPGMLARHYSPRTPLECVTEDGRKRVEQLRDDGLRVGWLTFGPVPALVPPGVVALSMPCDPAGYALRLYAALHDLDEAGVDRIVVALPPATEEWLAIHNRLSRAAAR